MVTVKQIIEKLSEFPEDMLVGIEHDPLTDIKISIETWVHSNYPYNKPDFDYVNIE